MTDITINKDSALDSHHDPTTALMPEGHREEANASALVE